MKKIALLGPAYAEYATSMKTMIERVKRKEGIGKALSKWTYTHDKQMLEIVKNQIEEIGYVNLYVYSTKNPRRHWSCGGTGLVNYLFTVNRIEYDDNILDVPDADYVPIDSVTEGYEPYSKGWYWIKDVKPIEEPRTWNSFRDYKSGESVGNPVGRMFVPHAKWTYVIDD